MAFKVHWTIILPIATAILGIYEITLEAISPLNWIFAALIFIMAGLMFYRSFTAMREEEEEEAGFEEEKQRAPSKSLVAQENLPYRLRRPGSEAAEKLELEDFFVSRPPERKPAQKQVQRTARKPYSVQPAQKAPPARPFAKPVSPKPTAAGKEKPLAEVLKERISAKPEKPPAQSPAKETGLKKKKEKALKELKDLFSQ